MFGINLVSLLVLAIILVKIFNTNIEMKFSKNNFFFSVSVLALIFIFITLYRFKNRVLEEEFIENLEEQNTQKLPDVSKNVQEYVSIALEGALKTIRPGIKGIPGPQGVQGPAGSNGGVFIQKGAIRSIKNPELFLDRDVKKLKLNNRDYRPSQVWTLNSDGILHNSSKPYQCLHYNNKNVLEMTTCGSVSKWEYDENIGQLKTANGPEKCLTMNNNGLSLENCTQDGKKPEQAWSFY